MAEVGRWNGHVFEVSADVLRSFSGLSIKAGCETEEKTSGKQKYVVRKAGNAAEVSLTVTLLRAFGCDVRTEVDAFSSDATAGAKDYFYVGNKKLVPCQLMLTQAEISEIESNPATGTWTAAMIKLTMKQADKGDGNTSSGSSSGSKSSSGSNKESVKTESLVSIVAGKVKEMHAAGAPSPENTAIKAAQKIALASAQVKVAKEKSKNITKAAGGNGDSSKMAARATR